MYMYMLENKGKCIKSKRGNFATPAIQNKGGIQKEILKLRFQNIVKTTKIKSSGFLGDELTKKYKDFGKKLEK